MNRAYKVTIVQATVKQYRESFYLQLRELLSRHGVELTVICSAPGRIDASKKDDIDLPAAMTKTVPRIYLLNDRILLQFLPFAEVMGSDLVIIDQATGCLHNYPLLLLSRLGLKKVAFWGHGYNRQGNPATLSERCKRHLINWSSSWFAYTAGTAGYLAAAGVPPHRITSVDNAVDTNGFRNILESVTDGEISGKRRQFGVAADDFIALYCGSLYGEKRIPYLLHAAKLIAEMEPRFRLLVVGAGPEAEIVRQACAGSSHVLYGGPLFGRDKAVCFRMADVFLNPGLVGLGILDSFCAGLPFVTTAEALHSPEIDYLADGVNGLMVSGDEAVFAGAVVDLMGHPDRMAAMRRAAGQTATRYTIENMVAKMGKGILDSLGVAIVPDSGVNGPPSP